MLSVVVVRMSRTGKHMASYAQVWSIGVVNTKLGISIAILPRVYNLKHSEALFASFDSLIVPMICSDAYMSRTSHFRDDDSRQTN